MCLVSLKKIQASSFTLSAVAIRSKAADLKILYRLNYEKTKTYLNLPEMYKFKVT